MDRAELDSHADTGVGGTNTLMIHDTGQRATVVGFSPSSESHEDIPIGTVVGAYDCPETGQTFILVWNQWLYFGERLPHSLINLNQLRYAGHKVFDTPTQFDMESPHAIRTPKESEGKEGLTSTGSSPCRLVRSV